MIDIWSDVAPLRHQQYLQREDITFFELFLPIILQQLQDQANYSSFKVLDVGCGTGFLARVLSNTVYEVVGIDPSQDSINLAETSISSNNQDLQADQKIEFSQALRVFIE